MVLYEPLGRATGKEKAVSPEIKKIAEIFR
jgi:hypothetical protein